MTPTELALATSLIGLVKAFGTWPQSLVLIVLAAVYGLGPWLVVIVVTRGQDKRFSAHELHSTELISELRESFVAATTEQDKRFAAVSLMYENNVLLVKGYERLASDLANIIHLNTQTNTKLVEKINNNHYCPVVRGKSGAKNG